MLWLDQLIFGNGYGLKSPYFDDKYFWLSGHLYTWSGWFGAQFQSFQWKHPKPGETRELLGRKFRPFDSSRHCLWVWRHSIFSFPLPIFRVRVAWSYVELPEDFDAANVELRKMKSELSAL